MLLLSLPFKTTTHIDFNTVFQSYFLSAFGSDNTYKDFNPFFSSLTSLRSKLDYSKLALNLKNQPDLSTEIEQTIINLLRSEYVLDKYFNFQTGVKNSVALPFSWTDSFNIANSLNVSSMKYELCGHLYNFAVNEYFAATTILFTPNCELQKKKIAVAKLKVGIWGLNEIKSFLPNLPTNLPSDLNRNYISILENLMTGLAYLTLLEILEKNENELGIENISTITNEASKNYKIALDILANDKENKIKQDLKKQLHGLCYVLYTLSFGITCMKLSIFHESNHQDNQTKGDFGLALSYIQAGFKAYTLFSQQKMDISNLPSIFRDRFITLSGFFNVNNIGNMEKRNSNIYKQMVFSENQLPLPPDINAKIKICGSRPSAFEKNLDGENLFENILNPEVLAQSETIKNLYEKEKQINEEKYKKIVEMKNRSYLENYVNFLIDNQAKASNSLPKTLETKRNAIISKGGAEKMNTLISALKENSINCGMLLANVKEKINGEQNEDYQLREKHQQLWNRIPSAQINKDYQNSIEDLNQKFLFAQNVDISIFNRHQMYNGAFEKILKKPEEILKMAPHSNNNSNSENQEIEEIRKLDIEINKLLQEFHEIIKEFSENQSKISFVKEIIDSKKNNITVDQAFSRLKKDLLRTDEMTTLLTTKINSLCVLAKKANLNKNNAPGEQQEAKFMEELTNSANVLNDVFDDIDQGLKFYQTLIGILLNLDKNVQDFCMAREMEKNCLLQEITQRMAGMNFQGGYKPNY